jgi:protein-tyrosine phosphatase
MTDPIVPSLAGMPNFRDIGGHATTQGRTVRRGLVFRSGESARLTTDDIDALSALDIRLIMDLRSEKERMASPQRWPLGVETELIETNIRADLRADNQSLSQILHDDPTPAGASLMMRITYEALPDACGPSLGLLFERLANGRAPTLFHCTLGRDRTGLVSAMLQHVLGVPYPQIAADYLKTNQLLDTEETRNTAREFLRTSYGFEADAETLDILSLVRLQNLETSYRVIAEKYGSPENYLSAYGISDDLLEVLRQRLLD